MSEKIHPRLALAACVERALHWKVLPKQRKVDVANWQDAKRQLEEIKNQYKVEMPRKRPQMLRMGVYN